MSFLAAFIHRQFIYTPPIPTTSFKGKTVIVTGANVGLGKEACLLLVRLGATKVILACRSIEKGTNAAKEIQTTTLCSPDTLDVWQLDLDSYASVQSFCSRAKTDLPRLDAIIANAGRMTRKFNLAEGVEETINTNVVSLFLQAFMLMPKLHETATRFDTQTYLTITSSELYEIAKFKERKAPPGQLFEVLNDEKKANMADRYNVSKLLEILMVKQMAKLYPIDSHSVVINCTAPGFCSTGLSRDFGESLVIRVAIKMLARPAEVGGRTLVYGASAGPESHGQYVPDCKITPTKGLTVGKEGNELQARVWRELKEKLESIRPGVTSAV